MRKLYEEVNPALYVAKGLMDVSDPPVRDNINTLLTGVLMPCTLTPYIALEKVRKTLSYFHIHISAVPFMEGDRGFHVFPVNQFGLKYGMKNDGQIVNFSTVEKDLTHGVHREGENFNSVETPETKVNDEKYHIYFEYKMNDKGMFDIFSEIVTDDELQNLLDDVEDDINDDDAEDDREERLNESVISEAKKSAVKIINELKLYKPDGTHEIDLGNNPERYIKTSPVERPSDKGKYTKRLLPDPRNTEVKKPFTPDKATVDATNVALEKKPYTSDSSDKSSNFTKPGGESPTGSDPFKGVTPRRKGDPGYGELPSGPNSIHSSTPISSTGYTLSDKKQPAQMQETSHESVNHVRRLAMKNRNDI